ncbi:hypothetical protein ACEPAF_4917 [Sanghuangporus sanghuang]
MSSGRSTIATVLHLLAAGIMTWGYMGLEQTVMHSTIITQKGGHLQFLTIQALAVSWFTMVLSLAYDLVPTKFFWNAKRAFFMIALSLSFVVTSIYWSLIILFPHIIVPPAPEKGEPATPSFAQYPDGLARIPLSLDLALHLTPALTLLVDFFLFEESYGKAEATWGATAMSALFGIWYASWVEYCASFNGTSHSGVRTFHNTSPAARSSAPSFAHLAKRTPIGVSWQLQARSLSTTATNFRNASYINAGNLRRSIWSSNGLGLGGALAGLGLSFAAFQLQKPAALCDGEGTTFNSQSIVVIVPDHPLSQNLKSVPTTPATAPPRSNPTPIPLQPDDALPPPPHSSVNVYELGFGTVTGICAGIFVKKGAKALAFVFGGVFVLLQYLASLRVIRVNWVHAESRFQNAFYSRTTDATGQEVHRPPTVYSLFHWIVDFLTADFQPRASFIAGLALGLRLG